MDHLKHALDHCSERKKQRELAGGWVYFIQAGEFVKIGVAKDVQQRLTFMQIGCPYDMVLLKAMECLDPYHDEEMIHAELEKYRVRGEWFKLPPAVLALLLKQ
jgi:hypothetical protein